ncbi:Tfp pilus assembly major pilin PilA [Rhizobium tibeticum]|uniref:Uncharacterized protein n=1 Tax=Rhizobium tibeticum TaxID=501024 RepID=A0A1H8UP71_9HYPH|nr:hypothetical protein [Rhizobium tibeticum]MDP9812403.1 Tfp pilus assembly major pilin PilA [Rhizobium tibeticum]SEI17702.1 hypothetical protein RTCCBAU85039_5689 [Rhizobium tibeticum]SEP04886.1 hypothetical protein SAMN05216228_103549 [Rhizobium tibeticum]
MTTQDRLPLLIYIGGIVLVGIAILIGALAGSQYESYRERPALVETE